MIKASLISNGLLLLALTTIAGLWQYERAQNASLEAANQVLNDANETNQQRLKEFMALNEKQSEVMNEYGQRQSELYSQLQQTSNQLTQLRTTEAQKALAAPFERGNAARNRRESIVMRAMGTRAGASRESSPDTEARDSEATTSPEAVNSNDDSDNAG